MDHINQFNKGLNSDVSPLQQPEGTYVDAQNLRVINDTEGTSLSINNVLGNFNVKTIPDTFPVFKLTPVDLGSPSVLTITINGTPVIAASALTVFTPQGLYDYLFNDPNFAAVIPSIFPNQLNVYIGETYLLLYQTTGGITYSFSSSGFDIIVDNNFISAQTNLEPIGFTTIRDDIYILTTNNTTKNPGGHNSNLPADPSSVGQIWKLTYDKLDPTQVSLTLIYNNYVDFSTYYSIPPTAILGRYENQKIQRIYWTDNFNKLRTLNVTNPNAFAIDVSILNIVPSTDFDIPIMQTIGNGGGSIYGGAYQIAYRLKNTGGAVTNFSELSNMVFVVNEDEATNTNGIGFKDYIGVDANTKVTSKTIVWQINNIDPDYERIEIALVYRKSNVDPGTFIIIHDDSIDFGSYTAIYDGTQLEIPLTLSEFLLLQGSFTHVKTIATKDNRLFPGNLRNVTEEITNFDTRAFRAFTSNILSTDIKLTNDGLNSNYTLLGAEGLTEIQDAINDYTDPTKACYFKPNTAGGILGGAGANISYEFYTVAISADRAALPTFDINNFVLAPWRSTNPRFEQSLVTLNVDSIKNDGNSVLQEYNTKFPNPINDGFKYPPYNGLYRGYQRNEIYRFAIQFFDKTKNLIFTKWIGDIKFPDFFEFNNNSKYEDGTSTPISDFRTSFVANKIGTYEECFVQSLGIKFTINNLETISNKIDGYSIVRVERTEEDKTIVSQGYIYSVVDYNGQFYTPNPRDGGGVAAVANARDNPSGNLGGGGGFNYNPNTYNTRKFFVTPDFQDGNLLSPTTGMTLKVKAQLTAVNSTSYVYLTTPDGGLNVDPFYFFKYYTQSNPGITPNIITNCKFVDYNGAITDSTNTQVNNYDSGWTEECLGLHGDNGTTSYGMNPRAYFIELTSGLNTPDNSPTGDQYLCNIERSLSSQYGGNNYNARSNNQYISCSHFRPIRTTSQPITDIFDVFGGDTFVNMYDSSHQAKNFGATNRGVPSKEHCPTIIGSNYGTHKCSSIFYFAVESKINTDLRNGIYFNKDLNGDTELQETYVYNSAYSCENNIRNFLPKPDPFIENDEFDNRIQASQIKIDGELIDNWGVFKTNDYWDVEGSYGPINAMLAHKDKVYFWQDKAFGIMSINPRVLITDQQNGTDLQLGTGNVLQRHDYISNLIGLKHQSGLTQSSYKLFWFDINNKKFYTYEEGQALTPESDVKGLFSFFNNNLKYNINTVDKPLFNDPDTGINGIRAYYDFKYNQAIFTFTDGAAGFTPIQNAFTISFDERLNCFSSFLSYTSKIYITDNRKVFSNHLTNNLKDLWLHDYYNYSTFYGTTYDSSIKIAINPYFQNTKVFDNLQYDSQSLLFNNTFNSFTNENDNTWNKIRVYNNYQNTDFQDLVVNTNIKRKERSWNLAIPRNRVLYTTSNSPNIFNPSELSSPTNKLFGERIRDKFILLDLVYHNTVDIITDRNKLLSFNNLKTTFRISDR